MKELLTAVALLTATTSDAATVVAGYYRGDTMLRMEGPSIVQAGCPQFIAVYEDILSAALEVPVHFRYLGDEEGLLLFEAVLGGDYVVALYCKEDDLS